MSLNLGTPRKRQLRWLVAVDASFCSELGILFQKGFSLLNYLG